MTTKNDKPPRYEYGSDPRFPPFKPHTREQLLALTLANNPETRSRGSNRTFDGGRWVAPLCVRELQRGTLKYFFVREPAIGPSAGCYGI
jgi:hypothetical protein